MLNAIYTYASEHRDLYPGVQNPGAQATKEAVEGATGLKINYWVLIDLKGFRVTGGRGRRHHHGRLPAGPDWGRQHQDLRLRRSGQEPASHWLSRHYGSLGRASDSSDYDRVLRQKCVMRAMLNQFDPITVLTKFNRIAAASREVVATDIPTSEVGTMIDLALKAKALPVSSVAIMPPLIDPSSPDFDRVRQHRPEEDRDLRGHRRVRRPNQRRQALRAPPQSPNPRHRPPVMRRPTILERSVQPDH